MRQHVNIVGYLYIGFGALYLLIACLVAVILLGAGLIALPSDGTEPLGILLIVAVSVGLLLLVLGLPGIIGGWGLLRLRSWARILVLVLAVVNLFNVPIGTALGIYTFWVLLNDETEKLFAASEPPGAP
jgi:hypothetical protein